MKKISLPCHSHLVYKLRSINNISKEKYHRNIGLKLYNLMINIIISFGSNDIRSTIPLSTHFSHNGVGVIISPGVKIGEYCVIGQNVTLGEKNNGTPSINDFVIIHAHSIIMGNINIGEFSVIGAGSVVIDDVPPMSLVVGNPARVIRKINDEEYLDYRMGKEVGG